MSMWAWYFLVTPQGCMVRYNVIKRCILLLAILPAWHGEPLSVALCEPLVPPRLDEERDESVESHTRVMFSMAALPSLAGFRGLIEQKPKDLSGSRLQLQHPNPCWITL